MLSKGAMFANNRDIKDSPAPAGRPITTTLPPATGNASPDQQANGLPQPAAAVEPPGARLMVGAGVKLKGAEIQDCDTLLVEGRVEATMDSRFIEIADQGSFEGKVNVDVAEIRGHFSGDLTARERLIIHSTGRVSGTIRYGRIVVHEGGEVSGDIKSLKSPESAVKPKPAEAANTDDSGVAVMSRLLTKTG
jgi:cytoskeletal protein CcmA (bactofilin family)